jgi:hypothetical protein
MIAIRSSVEPNRLVWLDVQEWRQLVEEMRSGKPFGVAADSERFTP